MFWSHPIEKEVLCCVLLVAKTRVTTFSIVFCEKSVKARIVRRSWTRLESCLSDDLQTDPGSVVEIDPGSIS